MSTENPARQLVAQHKIKSKADFQILALCKLASSLESIADNYQDGASVEGDVGRGLQAISSSLDDVAKALNRIAVAMGSPPDAPADEDQDLIDIP